MLYWEQNKFEESIEYFQMAIRMNNFDLIYYYIDTLHNLSMNKKAYDLLEKYNKFKDSDDDIKELFTKTVDLEYD